MIIKVGTSGKGINYISIWHVFRIKHYLRGNTINNEKVLYFPVSYQKPAYLHSEDKDEMFGRQNILHFSQENPNIKSILNPHTVYMYFNAEERGGSFQ